MARKSGNWAGDQESKSFPLAFGNVVILRACIVTGEVGLGVRLRWTEAQARDEWCNIYGLVAFPACGCEYKRRQAAT